VIDLAQVRLIFSDLDETLLGPDHRVGRRSREAIAGLKAAGIEVCLCTGRAPQTTRPIADELGLSYYICNNGASLYDGDTLLEERTIPAATVAALAARSLAARVPAYIMRPDGYFRLGRSDATDAADRARAVTPQPLILAEAARPAYKLMPWGGSHLYDTLLGQFGDAVNVVWHADYLEIGPAGVSKGWAAALLAERLGLTAAACLAMGDARNDLELIRWAGIGVAMENADPLLKAAADWTAPSHAVDGTADVLEAVLAAVTPSL
jgi:hydroxymethylpyrimidine pyrophosphatase-like HAD family hydrolase